MSGERMEIPDGQAREAWRASLSLKRHDGVMKGPRRNRRERRRERRQREEKKEKDREKCRGTDQANPGFDYDRRRIESFPG